MDPEVVAGGPAEGEDGIAAGDGAVVAASSGNTGAAIAMACGVRGYKCKIYTNTKCSKEKVDAVKAYGGEIVVGAHDGRGCAVEAIRRR